MDPNQNSTQPSPKEPSIVDTLLDAFTENAAKGLVVAKGALEVVARWLEARAKDAGELATKLSSNEPEQQPEPTTEPSS